MNKVIVIVPHYNHSNTIEHVVQQVLKQHLPVLIIDDGSAETHVDVLKTLQHTPNVFVHYCPTNGGKGAAMKIGFMKAAEMGFTHGIQGCRWAAPPSGYGKNVARNAKKSDRTYLR